MPQVDPDGILWFADRSINVSPCETDLLACLIRQFGTVVPRSRLQDFLPERPGGVRRNALDLHIMRLRRRIRPLGLVIRTARGRGYLLDVGTSVPAPAGPAKVTDLDSVRARRLGVG